MDNNVVVVIKIVGLILGIILTVIKLISFIRSKKVKLKITPTHVIPINMPMLNDINFGIEVLNLTNFQVTINEIGFLLKDGRKALVSASNFSTKAIPARLSLRESTTCYFNIIDSGINLSSIKTAYARTSCGVVATGTSDALKQLKKGKLYD